MGKKSLISIVVPSYNEQENIAVLFKEVKAVLAEPFEILFVDDGSSDGTLDAIKTLAKAHAEVRYVTFSRNFGHQAALRAGLRYAKGDAVISMDADLQHPPATVPALLDKWREGYDVVYTIRDDTRDNTTWFKRTTSFLFYQILNFLSGLHMKEGAADFRLLDRKVVDTVNCQQEADIFLRGYINWIGFKQVGVLYAPAQRHAGASKYSLSKMIAFAAKGVTQFSIKPLRLAFLLATFAFVMSFLYLIYALWAAFVNDAAVPGWLSLVTLFVFLQGIQFLLLGLIGEYLGRTFIQTKHRPEYIVKETEADRAA